MFLLCLPEKEKRYQSGPTYWKTNFSLSSRKENLSPQEFALRAEQRLETAPGFPWNCTAREEMNTPTDNEQLQPRPQGLLAFQYGGGAILENEKTLGTRLRTIIATEKNE